VRSIATVTVAPAETSLTTLTRVKSELNLTTVDAARDALLESKIDEASSDIEAHLARVLARATLSERFWGEPNGGEYLVLARAPGVSITSVTLDDVLVSASEYRLEPETGLLYRLDSSGYPCAWTWCKDVVIVYVAGYLLPAETGRTLPYALEAAAVELVSSYWASRGRDPTVRSEDIPGLGAVSYWVGAVGEAGDLPPGVESKIAPFRRVLV